MFSKLVIFASFFFFLHVNSQYLDQNIIDQTQHLQQIERYGTNYTNPSDRRYDNIYPTLGNGSTFGGSGFNNRSVGGLNNTSSRGGFNSTEKFLNRTISSMAKGVCVKEVKTATLLGKNEVAVAGNGSDPTLSRIAVCCEGYQRNIHNFRKCDPICSNDCVNGFCAAPETCVCFPDHVRNLAGFCLPTCPIGCGNGFCKNDNTCTCKDGFSLESNGKFCIPKCSFGCINGNCTAPEVCTCNKGYTFSPDGKCEPACSKGCKNGDCVAPEQCDCHKGFSRVNDRCEPICSRGCLNGHCVAPEKCECLENGWSLDSTGTKCTASCEKPCLNGICSGPNECSCKNGYVKDSFDAFRCVPKCDPPCQNGVCSGPNMCLCFQGYVKDRSVKGSQRCIKV